VGTRAKPNKPKIFGSKDRPAARSGAKHLANGHGQGFDVAAVSETTRYSYFLPFALNFILSLSSVNSMLVLTGIKALSAGFS
jgi:hypothetical protein